MAAGIRLTSGAELSHPTAPANYAQLRLTESLAREIFPLGDAVTDPPWHGLRPCSADMLPSIGAVPNQPGLFAAFGHGFLAHGLHLLGAGPEDEDVVLAHLLADPVGDRREGPVRCPRT